MTPEISEFSYGFALTNELVGWTALRAAPIFPSLIEEGKADGGYDVKLDRPGAPLFLQFKRADCLTRSSAREISKLSLDLSPPFFRFAITERNRSFQHTSLVTLDDGSNLVFYVAPRFHTLAEINDAWTAQNVVERSIFVDPKQIGLIADDEKHHVSYDAKYAFFCSEPQPLKPISASELCQRLETKLDEDTRPVRNQMVEWLENVGSAAARAREEHKALEARIQERKQTDTGGELVSVRQVEAMQEPSRAEQVLPPPTVEIKPGRPLNQEERMLRAISDQALHLFSAQLYVVQRQDAS